MAIRPSMGFSSGLMRSLSVSVTPYYKSKIQIIRMKLIVCEFECNDIMISHLLILQSCSLIIRRHAQSYLSSAITGASGTRVCMCVFRSCVDVCRRNCAAAAGDGGVLPVPLIISARRILHRERASVASCHAQIPHETLRLFQKTKQIVFIARLTRVAFSVGYNLFYVSNRLVFIHIYLLLQMFVICNFM